ncbi:hypothetical protein MKC73_11025, partial [[Clostridium] innocuum]|nr:hypothetical protein [[Clostridium] innocuum]
FSFLIKLLYIIHQKTPRTVKKKTEAPQVDVEGLSFPSYFRYSKENGNAQALPFFDSRYIKTGNPHLYCMPCSRYQNYYRLCQAQADIKCYITLCAR